MRKEWNIVLLGPLTLQPSPFDEVAEVESSGQLTLKMTDLICESKGGSVGAEELQCWEASNGNNPVIMTFKDVKKLNGGGLNARRLAERDGARKLQTNAFQFNCILSETDLTGTQDILINYERCQISSGSFEIGLTQAIGVGVTTYSSSLNTGTVILPSPIQDVLTTGMCLFYICSKIRDDNSIGTNNNAKPNEVVRDCDAQWTLDGFTSILIYGNEGEET